MTYRLCKTIITRGAYVRANMLDMLDAFLLGKRITLAQYNELVGMMPTTA